MQNILASAKLLNKQDILKTFGMILARYSKANANHFVYGQEKVCVLVIQLTKRNALGLVSQI